jgi:putative transcriptional regulator
METETLANIVRELRTQKDISQGKLAEMVGVTRQTIISLEKGSYIPSLLLAMRISKALEAPIETIFTREVLL